MSGGTYGCLFGLLFEVDLYCVFFYGIFCGHGYLHVPFFTEYLLIASFNLILLHWTRYSWTHVTQHPANLLIVAKSCPRCFQLHGMFNPFFVFLIGLNRIFFVLFGYAFLFLVSHSHLPASSFWEREQTGINFANGWECLFCQAQICVSRRAYLSWRAKTIHAHSKCECLARLSVHVL